MRWDGRVNGTERWNSLKRCLRSCRLCTQALILEKYCSVCTHWFVCRVRQQRLRDADVRRRARWLDKSRKPLATLNEASIEVYYDSGCRRSFDPKQRDQPFNYSTVHLEDRIWLLYSRWGLCTDARYAETWRT